jgi:hypothetical protein
MGEPFMTVYVVGQLKFTDRAAYERYAVGRAHAGEEAAVSISWITQMLARRSFKVVASKHLPAEDNSVRTTPILRLILNFLSGWDRKQRDRRPRA